MPYKYKIIPWVVHRQRWPDLAVVLPVPTRFMVYCCSYLWIGDKAVIYRRNKPFWLFMMLLPGSITTDNKESNHTKKSQAEHDLWCIPDSLLFSVTKRSKLVSPMQSINPIQICNVEVLELWKQREQWWKITRCRSNNIAFDFQNKTGDFWELCSFKTVRVCFCC